MNQNQTKIFVKDMEINAMLGIFEHEIGKKQPIRVNVEAVFANYEIGEDKIENTVSYLLIIEEIRRIADIQFSLVEKFSEHIADFTLSFAPIQSVRVKVEKLTICPEGIVGSEVIRTK